MNGTTNLTRVLIIDDDPVYRRILIHSFGKIPGAIVAAAVATLDEAKVQVTKGRIDLVTLDVVMKGESGLSFLPWVTRNYPKVVTALLTAGQEKRASQTVDAMLLGAVTLVLKPSGHSAPQQLLAALTRLVEGVQPSVTSPPAPDHTAIALIPKAREVLAVGASTGGPPMVLKFLKDLPASCRVPIILTQHMPAEHAENLAEMLRYPGGRPVYLAGNRDVLQPSHVYVAAHGKHLKVARVDSRLVIVQDDGPEENFCRPAVDPMFRAVAQVCGAAAVGVIMTGMGSDGALGSVAMRAKGAPVIVQDQSSSVVWGMPGAVVAAGAASAVISGSKLGITVSRLIS